LNLLSLILTLTGALVVDGDTLKLDGQRYRLWGIDAPERDEPGGPAATRALRQIIGRDRLTCDVLDVDRYGRPVVHCTLPDGSDPSCTLVSQGHAQDWPKYSGGHYAACE
jgi:endonuclease YncB( thermonuclease family)